MLPIMRKDYEFYVYIVANRSRTIYIGVTRNLRKRIAQHRDGDCDGFTKRYNIHRLVYFERFAYINNAITREKELKGWLREKKLALINAEKSDVVRSLRDIVPTHGRAKADPSLRSE
jgi:putative endonuclease